MNKLIFNALNTTIGITVVVATLCIIFTVIFAMKKKKKAFVVLLVCSLVFIMGAIFQMIYQTELQKQIIEEEFFKDGKFSDTIDTVQNYIDSLE